MTLEDADLVLHCQAGHRYNLLLAAEAKFILATVECEPVDRLRVLELMRNLISGPVTEAVLAVVEPCSATAHQIMVESRKLDTKIDRMASFNLLTGDLFGRLAEMNPSLVGALRMMDGGRRSAAAGPPARPGQPAPAPAVSPAAPAAAGDVVGDCIMVEVGGANLAARARLSGEAPPAQLAKGTLYNEPFNPF
jgi:hypothetical protein